MHLPRSILFALILPALLIQSTVAQESTWSSIATTQQLKMAVLKPEGFDSKKPVPLIIYLENLPAKRVGTESDDTIIQDFLKDGYLVVTLDYNHHPDARVPFINRDLGAIRDQVLHK